MLATLREKARRWFGGYHSPAERNLSLPAISEEERNEIWAKVESFTMTGRERITALIRSIEYLEQNNIEGDIVECGVWRGGSMMAAALALLRRCSTRRRLFLFDTFAGMPPPHAIDRDFQDQAAADLLAQSDKSTGVMWAYCPLAAVHDALAGTGYPAEQMVFVQGKVEDTVPEFAPPRIALLRLDTDWHESTAHELEYLYPRLAEGGVLIVDDYGHWQGARRAVDEYFDRIRQTQPLQDIDYTGRLLIKKKDNISMEYLVAENSTRTYSAAPPAVDAPRILHLGCGTCFHPACINVDLHPAHSSVLRHDVTKPLSFHSSQFDAVYHSHLLEHLPTEAVPGFLAECQRVLRPGGILRIAVPDLEQIVRLYLEALENALAGDASGQARHEWVLLELVDQLAREKPGGAMLDYFRQPRPPAQRFALDRLGADGQEILRVLAEPAPVPHVGWRTRLRSWFSPRCWRERCLRWLLGADYDTLQRGRFRQSGEIHRTMYDRYSLSRLMSEAGLRPVHQVDPGESQILGWEGFHLERDGEGNILKPDSLFVEGVKPGP